MPPPGPPRVSQSSIRTSQPTPIIVPKPKVKYSTVLRPPWRPCAVARPSVFEAEQDGLRVPARDDDEDVVVLGVGES